MVSVSATAGAATPQQILTLARSRTGSDRERLMLSIVDLCQAGLPAGERLAPPVEGLVVQLFRDLIERAEREMRQALAERLADCDWAPHALVSLLAHDDIDIARPLIAASPVLTDDDLIDLLHQSAIEHQIEVARRPGVSEPVIAHIIDLGQPAVLTALADNESARLTADAMRWLVEASREVASLRAPLAHHARLSPELAERLYLWVGESLRQAIGARFEVDAAALSRALDQSVADVRSEAVAALTPVPDRRRMERQLVAKLRDAGQLKPGYLMRALRDQRLTLFTAALAELSGLELTAIEGCIEGDQPELLSLACTAAGIDRGAFATILGLVRQLTFGRPSAGGGSGRRALQAFAVHDPELAAVAFRQGFATAN